MFAFDMRNVQMMMQSQRLSPEHKREQMHLCIYMPCTLRVLHLYLQMYMHMYM